MAGGGGATLGGSRSAAISDSLAGKQVGVRRAGDWVMLPSGVRLALVAALTKPINATDQAAFVRKARL